MVERLRLAAMMANPKTIDRIQGDHSNLENESPENIDFVMSKMYESIGDWDWRDDMSNLLMPVLTIQGEQDAIPMNSAVEWVEILPNARLFKIPERPVAGGLECSRFSVFPPYPSSPDSLILIVDESGLEHLLFSPHLSAFRLSF